MRNTYFGSGLALFFNHSKNPFIHRAGSRQWPDERAAPAVSDLLEQATATDTEGLPLLRSECSAGDPREQAVPLVLEVEDFLVEGLWDLQ